MFFLRMAGCCGVAGLIFFYGLSLWLPGVLFYLIGIWWTALAWDHLTLEIEMEEE